VHKFHRSSRCGEPALHISARPRHTTPWQAIAHRSRRPPSTAAIGAPHFLPSASSVRSTSFTRTTFRPCVSISADRKSLRTASPPLILLIQLQRPLIAVQPDRPRRHRRHLSVPRHERRRRPRETTPGDPISAVPGLNENSRTRPTNCLGLVTPLPPVSSVAYNCIGATSSTPTIYFDKTSRRPILRVGSSTLPPLGKSDPFETLAFPRLSSPLKIKPPRQP